MFRHRLVFMGMVAALAPTLHTQASEAQVTRQNCPQNPLCRIVNDADSDGEISDDLRVARNQLLYASPPAAEQSVYLFPPVAGTYAWNGVVRFCGDATPPEGDLEPNCDGAVDLPTIVFAGTWSSVVLQTSCAPPVPPATGRVTGCLQIGDLMEGDSGLLERRVRVMTHQKLRFEHVATYEEPSYAAFHPVYAVWLDGLTDSLVSVQVGRNIPDPWGQGAGVYASASNSLLDVTLVGDADEANGTLSTGLVLDGDMSGSEVVGNADLADAKGGMVPAFLIGTYAFVAPPGSLSLFPYGPNDGCAYGPDPVQSCRDFAASLTLRTPANNIGGEGLILVDGDAIDLDVDFEYLTQNHRAILSNSSQWRGGDVTITGSVVYRGLNEAGTAPMVAASAGPHITFDLPFQSIVWSNPTCISGTPTLGPNYECLGVTP